MAKCDECDEIVNKENALGDITEENDAAPDGTVKHTGEMWTPNYRYIGESSRPLRERVSEHVDNLKRWKKESFWLEHWLLEHGTEISPPKFSFSILSTFPDPLRRQIAEALHIVEMGYLNKKRN